MLLINWRPDENKTLDDVGFHDGRMDQPTTAGTQKNACCFDYYHPSFLGVSSAKS